MFDKLWLEWMTHPGIGCVVLGFLLVAVVGPGPRLGSIRT